MSFHGARQLILAFLQMGPPCEEVSPMCHTVIYFAITFVDQGSLRRHG